MTRASTEDIAHHEEYIDTFNYQEPRPGTHERFDPGGFEMAEGIVADRWPDGVLATFLCDSLFQALDLVGFSSGVFFL